MGYDHPDHLLPRLTARQYQGWQSYYRRRPFGDALIDSKLATLICVLANCHREPGSKPFAIEDFAPYLKVTPEVVDISPEENARLIRAQLDALRNP